MRVKRQREPAEIVVNSDTPPMTDPPILSSDTGELILASQSPSRADLLARAGLRFRAVAAFIDEDEIKLSLKAADTPVGEIARALAELKATRISERFSQAFVIGADQMMTCGKAAFDKPADMDQARAHLTALRGRAHELHTAVSVARQGAVIWHHIEVARLTMRPFTDGFIDDYLAAVGERALTSVGAYQLEGPGVQLFDSVEGDFFTVLGLPLLPLIAFLRGHGMVGT